MSDKGALFMKKILLAFDKGLNKLTTGASMAAGLFILLTAFIILYEIIMRGIFHSPTEWVLEISTYFIIMAGFLGLAVAFRQGAHVRVDLLADKLPEGLRRKVNMTVQVMSFLLFLIFMTESIDLVTASLTYNKLSPSILRFPLFIPQAALVLGSALLLGEIARRFLLELLGIADLQELAAKEETAAAEAKEVC